ncbi:hypothetical protein [Methylobacterium brachiatum]|jgi:hypothetical protein|uniref:hypothetical protein n=1 Tax=Methylobacterium brachiatum TaxID=269660 RepID=UPI00244B5B13|nr:hypothetical protein [Methylobacterium brachiatum]MDH2311406.1 hypothetical protein [Methylobacterium brachiatum]
MTEQDPNHEIVAARLMQQLHGFAQGLGLDDEMVRHIVDRVIVDMPLTPDPDRAAEARNWMLLAAG